MDNLIYCLNEGYSANTLMRVSVALVGNWSCFAVNVVSPFVIMICLRPCMVGTQAPEPCSTGSLHELYKVHAQCRCNSVCVSVSIFYMPNHWANEDDVWCRSYSCRNSRKLLILQIYTAICSISFISYFLKRNFYLADKSDVVLKIFSEVTPFMF